MSLEKHKKWPDRKKTAAIVSAAVISTIVATRNTVEKVHNETGNTAAIPSSEKSGKKYVKKALPKMAVKFVEDEEMLNHEEEPYYERALKIKEIFETLESDDLVDKAEKAYEGTNNKNATEDYIRDKLDDVRRLLVVQGKTGNAFDLGFLEQIGLSKEELQDKVRELIVQKINSTGGANSPWLLRDELTELEQLEKFYEVTPK